MLCYCQAQGSVARLGGHIILSVHAYIYYIAGKLDSGLNLAVLAVRVETTKFKDLQSFQL